MNKKTIKLLILTIIFLISISLFIKVFKPNVYIFKKQYINQNGNTTVDIIMSSVTPTSASILVEDTTRFFKLENKYKIQKKSFNTWKDVNIIVQNDEPTYNINIYEFPYNPILIFSIDWSNLYGSLPNGNYRIICYDYDTRHELCSNEFKLPKELITKSSFKNEDNQERYNNVSLDALVSTASPTGIRFAYY